MNFTQYLRTTIVTSYMANITERLSNNVAGAYYVDSSCIDCDLCRNTAPEFFKRDDEIGFTIVYRQPVGAREIALAESAKDGCPSESIGNDGQTADDAALATSQAAEPAESKGK